MANDKRYSWEDNSEKNSKKAIIILIVAFIIAVIMIFAFGKPIYDYFETNSVEEFLQEVEEDIFEVIGKTGSETDNDSDKPQNETVEMETVDGTLEMYMIDVGQADSFLFIQGNYVMLVDAGTRGSGDDVVAFLKEKNIDKIDVLIGSHTHDDHMGGITKVLNSFEVETFYFPERSDVTTKWYLTMLDTVIEKDIVCGDAKQGDIISLGQAKIQFITSTDSKEDKDINNSSIVIRVSYGEIDFLLGGDIEVGVEEEILASGIEIQSEVFKASHHGSDTSNSRAFVEEVDPDHIFISCGEGNKYKHPCLETIELFKELDIPVYRTDEQGTVAIETNGEKIAISKNPGSYSSGEE